MNFNLQFSILAVMTIAALLPGCTLAAAEGSQTNRRLRGNNQQRVLASTFCPEYNPGSNTACSLTGMYVGTCYYSSSAKNAAEAINTDSQACSCNANKSGTFVCTSQPFPGKVPTMAPVPAGPTPTTPDPVWCPINTPNTNDVCTLPPGKSSGSCSFSSSTTANGMT